MKDDKKMKYDEWSRWFKFGEVFEYHGLIGPSNSQKVRKHLDVEGPLANDDGFRLRSKEYQRPVFQDHLLKSLQQVPCPLEHGDVGVYWFQIKHEDFRYDYIGKCAENQDGIRKRLTQHFRKICNVKDHPYQDSIADELRFTERDERGFSVPEKFKKASDRIRDCGLDPSNPKERFWDKHCRIKFVKIDPTKATMPEKVHRIEGMALQLFFDRFGNFPSLNTSDETRGIKGF